LSGARFSTDDRDCTAVAVVRVASAQRQSAAGAGAASGLNSRASPSGEQNIAASTTIEASAVSSG